MDYFNNIFFAYRSKPEITIGWLTQISSICAARSTTVLVPPTSIAQKVWTNVTTILTRTLCLPCWQTNGLVVGSIGAFASAILRKAQITRRHTQHGASGSVKGRDYQTTNHSPTWIRVGNILSRASSRDRLVVVRQRLSLNCYEMLPQWSTPHPKALRVFYREWQAAYENLDIPTLHLEEGLPTSFDASKRSIVVLEYIMAENDERVTNLFTKKATTVIHQPSTSCRTCFNKQGKSHH